MRPLLLKPLLEFLGPEDPDQDLNDFDACLCALDAFFPG